MDLRRPLPEAKAAAGGLLFKSKEDLMAKGKAKKKHSGVRKPRTPAVIPAFSGSGYHSPGKYSKADRKTGKREVTHQRDQG